MYEFDFNKETDILLVDDDQTLLKFFKIHLNKFFSRVMVVKSAGEALYALSNKPMDLVISDIKMPKEDGIQLMRKIRIVDHTIPVLLISGALLSQKESDSVENKADGFLEKPFELEQLHIFILRGIIMRQIYKEIAVHVADPLKFQKLVRGGIIPRLGDTNKNRLIKELKAKLDGLCDCSLTLEEFIKNSTPPRLSMAK